MPWTWSNNPVMKISKHFAVFCLLPAILAINACSGLTQSDRPATNTWWLEPYTDMSGLPSSDPALLVAVSVTVVPGLDTDRILTLTQKSQLNHYSGARWADNLPELLTSLVTRTIQASPRFELAAGGPEDCNLRLEVQEFFALIGSSVATTAVGVAMEGQFHCGQNKPVSLKLNASVPISDDRMSAIVAAFQQAVDGVMRDMLERL